MKIKLHAPLDRILGPGKKITIDHPVSVGEFPRSLTEENPDLAPYAAFGPKDVQPYALLIWRNGKMLTLQDILHPADELEIIPMIAGG